MFFVFVFASGVAAAEREQRLSELHHTSWTHDEGAPGDVLCLAQTPDGFLWLAGPNGLFRFDGVTFESFESATGVAPLSRGVTALAVLRDGRLMIGYQFGGITVLRNGTVTHYRQDEGVPARTVAAFAEDADGMVWASLTSGLLHLRETRWEPLAADAGLPPNSDLPFLLADRSGTVWVYSTDGAWSRRRGESRFLRHTGRSVSAMAEPPDGSVWIAEADRGVNPVAVPGRSRSPSSPRRHLDAARGIAFDRAGTLWASNPLGGIQRVRRPMSDDAEVERLDEKDGLSANVVNTILEDREGNVWLGTTAGLDRLRRSAFTRVPLPPSSIQLGMAPVNGDVMVVGGRLRPPFEIGPAIRTIDSIPEPVACVYRDAMGEIWVGNKTSIFRRDGGRYREIFPRPPAGLGIQALARDRGGVLWTSISPVGVFALVNGSWVKNGGIDGLPGEPALTLHLDAAGRLWLGYTNNRLGLIDAGRATVFSKDHGIRIGNVTAISSNGDHVWLGGADGLARSDRGGRFVSVPPEQAGDFSGLSGVIETSGGDLWLNGSTGVTRVPREQVARSLADASRTVAYERFDHHDGVQGWANQLRPQPSIVAGLDGRLWFSTSGGLQWIDPQRPWRAGDVPPVLIKALRSGTQVFRAGSASARLPAATTQVSIDYTSTSLAMPDRVSFRYRLQGVDETWVDAGRQRSVFYTNLGPGRYSFQVETIGGYDTRGAAATVAFEIPPTFVQTHAFLVACGLLTLVAVWLLYRFRLRRLALQMQARLDERLAERERIARELHDTLLQGLQGLVLQLETARQLILQDMPALGTLEQALDRADHVIAEGRDRVQGLRAVDASPSLSTMLTAIAEQLSRDHASPTPPSFTVRVTGDERELHSVVAEEAARIGQEALVNAFQHAGAAAIGVELAYSARELRLVVRDDGTGFDVGPDSGDRPGHWGLVGMRERAEKIRAQVEIRTQTGTGTEVELRIPGRVAFRRRRLIDRLRVRRADG